MGKSKKILPPRKIPELSQGSAREHNIRSQRAKGGDSDPWNPERGLQEGCPKSPTLFKIYHQVVMRAAEKRRREQSVTHGLQVVIKWHWLPENRIPRMTNSDSQTAKPRGNRSVYPAFQMTKEFSAHPKK